MCKLLLDFSLLFSIDPLGLPHKVGSDYCFHACRPSVRPTPLFTIKQNKTDHHCQSCVGWPRGSLTTSCLVYPLYSWCSITKCLKNHLFLGADNFQLSIVDFSALWGCVPPAPLYPLSYSEQSHRSQQLDLRFESLLSG